MCEVKTKVCTKCKVEKPATLEFFCSEKRNKTGINSLCKECHNSYNIQKQKEKSKQNQLLKIELFNQPNKICSKCSIEYPRTTEFFNPRKQTLDGLRNECKICLNKFKAQKRDIIKTNTAAKVRREKLKNTNPIKYREYLIKQNKRTRQYRQQGFYPNGESVSEVRKRNAKNRYIKILKCPLQKMIKDIRGLISQSIKNNGYSKDTKTYEILGCDYQLFKQHIESKFLNGMSWENRGRNGWHFDHIIPISSAKNIDEIIKLNHYTNFQPLWEKDNLRKSNKISEEWGNA